MIGFVYATSRGVRIVVKSSRVGMGFGVWVHIDRVLPFASHVLSASTSQSPPTAPAPHGQSPFVTHPPSRASASTSATPATPPSYRRPRVEAWTAPASPSPETQASTDRAH